MENAFITSPRLHYRIFQKIAIRALGMFQKADRFFGTKIYEIDSFLSKSAIQDWFEKSEPVASDNSFTILNDSPTTDQILLNNKNKRWAELALKDATKKSYKIVTKHVLDLGNNTFTEIKKGSSESKLSNDDLTNGTFSGLVEQEEARVAKKILAHQDEKGLKDLKEEICDKDGGVNFHSNEEFCRLFGLKA